MRFVSRGPDIPAGLLQAQERGETVFICGAGVSRTVGLPSFWTLVEQVYQALHEHWSASPAETKALEAEPPALDRALFALQVRLSGLDVHHAGQVRARIIGAVEGALALPDGDLPAHGSILRLSLGADARPRIVTTNFDTLFERAWQRRRGTTIPSHAGASMPAPGSADFEGVLHLHGRMKDVTLGLGRTDLVLNSADFGEAYLRSSWAARYVYDLARTSTLVIVGYGADDPPVRYLLEVLTADRTRFTDLKVIFAFVSAPDEALGRERAADWVARGATPILYHAPGDADHRALYDTLAAWADHADDPAGWRARRAGDLMSRAPDDLEEHDWDQLAWVLSRGDGAALLATCNPAPAWLPALLDREMAGGAAASVGRWIGKRIADPGMLEQAVAHLRTDDDIAWHISRALEDESVSRPMETLWRLLARRRPARRWEDGWYSHMRRARGGGTGYDVQQGLVAALRPVPVVRPPFHWPGMPEPTGDRVADLASVEFRLGEHVDPGELLATWPCDADETLLRRLVAALVDALDEAVYYEVVSPVFDHANEDVSSVAAHSQDRAREGFYPLVRLIADLAERLAAERPDAVREVMTPLARSPYYLARRLHLHTLTFPTSYTGTEAAAALLDLRDDDFWASELRRETMRLMAERWADFPADRREALEARLAAGLPLALLNSQDIDPDKLAAIRDHDTFVRLSRLAATDIGFGPVGRAELDRIRAAHPHWWAEPGDRGDFGSWSEMRMGEQGDTSLLAEIPTDRLVEEAQAIAMQDPFSQGELWRKFVRADSERAFDGLVARAARGDWPASHWIPFLWALSEINNGNLARLTTTELLSAPPDEFGAVASAAASWLDRRHEDFVAAHGRDAGALLELWDRLVEHAEGEERDEELPTDDPMFAVLNRMPGHLATVLVKELIRRRPDEGSGLPPDLAPRFDRLAALQGTAGFIAMAGLMEQLPFLHHGDPGWAEAHLLPRLAWTDPWAAGIWKALSRNARIGRPALFQRIKPMFLEAFGRSEVDPHTMDGLVGNLMAILVRQQQDPAAEGMISFLVAKHALVAGGNDARRDAAYFLFDLMRHAGDRAAEQWRTVVGPIFTAAWPVEPELQSADSTLYLSWMASEAGDAFPEAVTAVVPVLGATGRADHSMVDHLSDERADLYRKHPLAALTLLDALIHPERPPHNLSARLDELLTVDPAIRVDPRFERLRRLATGA